MRKLWAPWRNAYVSGVGDGGGGCFLCEFPAAGDDAKHGILWRGRRWYALLNAYPYTNGHLMLVLGRHHEGFDGLDPEEAAELAPALARCEAAMRTAYAPHGINVGVNLGRAAGSGTAAVDLPPDGGTATLRGAPKRALPA